MLDKLKKQRKLRNNEYYDIQDKFDTLYQQSLEGKTFSNLIEIVKTKENIMLAFRNIKKNRGSKTKGTDGKIINHLKKMSQEELVEYVQKKLENYFPNPVRRIEIKKENGKNRPLGIPTISDRLIQQSILQVLEPICEAKFSNNSYGFRPNRSTENAVAKAMNNMQKKHMHYCVDIDIKGFFDNVNHGKLMKQMWTLGIQDKRLIEIISRMLKSEIKLPNGEIIKSEKGTPQGGIISPLLSNIVLNELDRWIESQWETKELKEVKPQYNKTGSRLRGNEYQRMRNKTTLKEMHIVRYCDDFKIFTNAPKTANKIYIATKMWLKERLYLDISPEKSKVTNLRKHYTEFLGFKLKLHSKRKKQVVESHISEKAKKRIKEELKEQVKKIKRAGNEYLKQIQLYNSKCLGIHNYYQIATHCIIDFGEIAYVINKSLQNRLKLKKKGTNLPKYIEKRYGESKQLRYVADIAIIPIGKIKTKNAMDKKISINKYTKEGREEIHKRLQAVDQKILKYLIENPISNKTIEYNDNRISLYSGQNGKCQVTGKKLEIGEMHCHHKVKYSETKDDGYSNLVFVVKEIHILIHAIEKETIEKYVNLLKLTREEIGKINNYRKKLQLETIS